MIDKQYLGALSTDFIKVADRLQKVSCTLRKRDYAYPIFLMSKEPVALGALLIPEDTYDNRWHYYVAYLALLIENNLIIQVADFKKHYKDPDKYCCLLVVQPDFIHFLYTPYSSYKEY